MGASSALYLMMRAGISDGTESASTFFKDVEDGKNNTLTEGIIENLVFAESKSIRTSTVILTAFNVLASFVTAFSILYDCYWASKRCNPTSKASKFCVSIIHPAETFPLVLSIGIAIQGVIFAAVQGEGLHSLNIFGCSTIAQVLWIALFIVPYIQLVFGLECALRSLKKAPFQPRGKYDVTICLGIIVLMLIGTWIPTHIFPQPDRCFASLLWFVSRFGKFGLILLSTVVGLVIISAITIFVRLSKTTLMERNQRIAASRMVYYLVVGIVSSCFVIPYFVAQTIGSGRLKTAMMATVVLNLSGLLNGLLHLFLRSNTATTSFGPRGRSWPSNKHEIRIWGPNELTFNDHMMDPVPEPAPLSPRSALVSQAGSQKSFISSSDKSVVISTTERAFLQQSIYPSTKSNSLHSNSFNSISSRPIPPTPTENLSSEQTRNQSYSLFPPPALESPITLLPPQLDRSDFESVYDISDFSDLAPPPPLHDGLDHIRGSSVSSFATVQIGIRFSHAPPPVVPDIPLGLPSTTYEAAERPATNFQAPALPTRTYTPRSKFNPATISTSALSRILLPPIQTTNLTKTSIPIPPRSPFRPSPSTNANNTTYRQKSPTRSNFPRSTSLQKSPSINKTLPASPRPLNSKQPAIERLEQSDAVIQLSPTVYTPPEVYIQRKGSVRSIYTRLDSNRRGSRLGQLSKNQWI